MHYTMNYIARLSLMATVILLASTALNTPVSWCEDGPFKAGGVIKKDTTWSGEVVVESDVLVPEGVTLTIAPGSDVLFVPSESTKIEPMFLSMQTELLVRGALMAKGMKENPITFGAAPADVSGKKPERGDWGGIIFDGPSASGSVVEYVRITKADTGITTYYSSPVIKSVGVNDCKYGLALMGASAPKLVGVSVTGCEYGLITSHGAKPEMSGCEISGNEQSNLVKDR